VYLSSSGFDYSKPSLQDVGKITVLTSYTPRHLTAEGAWQNLGVIFGVSLRYLAKKGRKYVLSPPFTYILHVSFIGCTAKFGTKITMFAYKVKHRNSPPKITTFREPASYDPIHPVMRHLIGKVYCIAISEG